MIDRATTAVAVGLATVAAAEEAAGQVAGAEASVVDMAL